MCGWRLLIPVVILTIAAMTMACRGPRSRCNVILLSLDTLRADHVGIYGYHRDTTPNIDRLARRAVLFSDPIAPAPQTLASHASLFTSLLPSHHGALGNFRYRLAGDAITMAEILAKEGYTTASFNDGGLLHADFGCDQGFGIYDSTEHKSRLAGRVAPALEWLSAGPREPFLLFLHTYEVHLPLEPESRFLALFESAYDGPLPDHFSTVMAEQMRDGELVIGTADLDHIVALYDAAIRSLDTAFQDLVAFLRRQGFWDRSLVIVTSDHGEEFGERGRVAVHGPTLYDEVLRVPLIIKLPHDRFAGTVVDRQVRIIDILPTVLDVIGVKPLPHFEGSSLIGLVRGRRRDHLPAVSETRDGTLVSLRDGTRKLIRLNRRRWLYDIEADPAEQRTVADSNLGVVRHLRDELDAILAGRPTRRTTSDPDAESLEQLRALGYLSSPPAGTH